MSYQAVRRYYEEPVAAVGAALSIAVGYANQLIPDGDANSEFLIMRLNFGNTVEPALCGNLENLRGSFIVEYLGPKGIGPGRAQEVMAQVCTALNQLTTRPTARVNGVLGTITSLNGPSFTALDDRPNYFASVSASIVASYKTP